MGQFNPEFYQQYRPYYPVELFRGVEKSLKKRGFLPPFSVVDLGCGAGHSSLSFLRSEISAQVIGIDPDPGMLKKARENAETFGCSAEQRISFALWDGEELETQRSVGQTLEFRLGKAEQTGLPAHSVDFLLVGSAFHWMDPLLACEEFYRILKPQGLIQIFETQFPKALDNPELNEWIRREFNLNWKAPGQVPRGRLPELLRVFREDSRFQWGASKKIPMQLELSPYELAGLIFSQSRVFHFESTLKSEEEVARFRASVQAKLQELMSASEAFDFKLSSFEVGLASK